MKDYILKFTDAAVWQDAFDTLPAEHTLNILVHGTICRPTGEIQTTEEGDTIAMTAPVDGYWVSIRCETSDFPVSWSSYIADDPRCLPGTFSPYTPPTVDTTTLENVKEVKRSSIDAETSAAILAGFTYAVDGTSYHFSYDRDDQQNFADTANMCILKSQGTVGLPNSVLWNAYTLPDMCFVRLTLDASAFLTLYTAGAMAHKHTQMQHGGLRKAAVDAATTLEEIAAL